MWECSVELRSRIGFINYDGDIDLVFQKVLPNEAWNRYKYRFVPFALSESFLLSSRRWRGCNIIIWVILGIPLLFNNQMHWQYKFSVSWQRKFIKQTHPRPPVPALWPIKIWQTLLWRIWVLASVHVCVKFCNFSKVDELLSSAHLNPRTQFVIYCSLRSSSLLQLILFSIVYRSGINWLQPITWRGKGVHFETSGLSSPDICPEDFREK